MKRLSVFAVLVSMFALSMACGSSGGGGIEFADFALKMNMAALDDVIVTADGHYLTAGDTHDDDSVVVAKVGPDGTLIWQKILDLDGFRVKLAEVSDGYLLFCALEIPANGDDNDAVMFKLDYDGEIVWEKHYTNGRYDEFRDIYVVGDRIFALMLIQTGPDWFDQETYLAEFDSNGNPVSGKTVDIDAGVDDNCSFNEIVSDGTSTYIAGAVYLDGDGRYLIIAKLNESYEVEWCKYFGTGEDCYAEGLTLHPDGGVVFCAGILGFGAGDYDGFVAHFDADGTIQWQMTYGTQSYDDVMATAFLSDGTMMIAGYTEGTPNSEAAIFIAKLNEFHVDEWSYFYGDADLWALGGFTVVEDKGFVFSSFSSNWDDQQYAWLMAVNDTGVFDDTVPYITDMPRCVEWISSFVPTDISLTLADFSVTVSDGLTTIVDDPRTIEQVYPEQ